MLSQAGDRRLSPLPFAHVGSMTRVWDESANGVTTVITPTPWKAADAVSIMESERITVAQGVPTQWALVLARPELDGADLSALRIAGTGASRVPAELVAAMREALGVPVVVRYTSTEASLGTGTVPGDPDEAVATSVGTPGARGGDRRWPMTTARPVPDGEVGRVRLRSDAVMRGYWGGPPTGPGAAGLVLDRAATDAVLADDGWLTTGDFGYLDGDGRLHLVGRANELYIRGGYNVYPAEVEAALGDHPGSRPGGGGGCARPGAGRDRAWPSWCRRRGPSPIRSTCWPSCAGPARADAGRLQGARPGGGRRPASP